MTSVARKVRPAGLRDAGYVLLERLDGTCDLAAWGAAARRDRAVSAIITAGLEAGVSADIVKGLTPDRVQPIVGLPITAD